MTDEQMELSVAGARGSVAGQRRRRVCTYIVCGEVKGQLAVVVGLHQVRAPVQQRLEHAQTGGARVGVEGRVGRECV